MPDAIWRSAKRMLQRLFRVSESMPFSERSQLVPSTVDYFLECRPEYTIEDFVRIEAGRGRSRREANHAESNIQSETKSRASPSRRIHEGIQGRIPTRVRKVSEAGCRENVDPRNGNRHDL